MEIKVTSKQVLKVLQVLSWLIFIGLCVEAGAIITNTVIAIFIHPSGAENFWEGKDYLHALYASDKGHFIVVTAIMSIVAVLKAIMFYLIVKMFTDKKLDMSRPFSPVFLRFISNLSYLSLGIGLFCYYGFNYTQWLTKQNELVADLQALHIAGADVWLFMSVILFVIVHIVKRGIEIQTENDLTI